MGGFFVSVGKDFGRTIANKTPTNHTSPTPF
jgi:hypothetical protein